MSILSKPSWKVRCSVKQHVKPRRKPETLLRELKINLRTSQRIAYGSNAHEETHHRNRVREVCPTAQVFPSAEIEHDRLETGLHQAREAQKLEERTQSNALDSAAQTSGHASGVIASVDRDRCALTSAFSSRSRISPGGERLDRGSVGEEQLIQDAAKDLKDPVCSTLVGQSFFGSPRCRVYLDLGDKVVCILLWSTTMALVDMLCDHASICSANVSVFCSSCVRDLTLVTHPRPDRTSLG